jgi:hypothetical protein
LKAETQKFIQSLFSDSSLNRLPEAYGGGREQISYPVGCAFCQFDVPCMDRNPVKPK